MPLARWAFDPLNSSAVAGWGFWLAVVGLVITLLGFWVTLWQLSQTKTAAEASFLESKRIQLSLKNFDAAQEISKAKYALNETKKHFSNGAWIHGSETYDDVRISILSVRDNIDSLKSEMVLRIDAAADFIGKLCGRIDKQVHDSGPAISYTKTREVIREHSRLLDELFSIVQKEIF